MKITIGGSMTFAKEQFEVGEYLKNYGHEILLTDDIEHFIKTPDLKLDQKKVIELSLQYDVIRSFFDKIAESDAYLVCNYEKNGIKGYLGTSVLMEIGVAYHLNKKIYLFNEIDRNHKYGEEIEIINPTILNGELSKI